MITLLSNKLMNQILDDGYIPIWCASVSNIGSQRVAINSGYVPLWLESYGTIYDDNYSFKD